MLSPYTCTALPSVITTRMCVGWRRLRHRSMKQTELLTEPSSCALIWQMYTVKFKVSSSQPINLSQSASTHNYCQINTLLLNYPWLTLKHGGNDEAPMGLTSDLWMDISLFLCFFELFFWLWSSGNECWQLLKPWL